VQDLYSFVSGIYVPFELTLYLVCYVCLQVPWWHRCNNFTIVYTTAYHGKHCCHMWLAVINSRCTLVTCAYLYNNEARYTKVKADVLCVKPNNTVFVTLLQVSCCQSWCGEHWGHRCVQYMHHIGLSQARLVTVYHSLLDGLPQFAKLQVVVLHHGSPYSNSRYTGIRLTVYHGKCCYVMC